MKINDGKMRNPNELISSDDDAPTIKRQSVKSKKEKKIKKDGADRDPTESMDTSTSTSKKGNRMVRLEISAAKVESMDKRELQKLFTRGGAMLYAIRYNPETKVCRTRLRDAKDVKKALAMTGTLCNGSPILVKLDTQGKRKQPEPPSKHSKIYFRHGTPQDMRIKTPLTKSVIQKLVKKAGIIKYDIKLFKDSNSGYVRLKSEKDIESFCELHQTIIDDLPLRIKRKRL